MDEYISKEAVLNLIAENNRIDQMTLECYDKLVEGVFNMDSIGITRCKDCENWQQDWYVTYSSGRHYCGIIDRVTAPDWFCTDGKRREM